MLNDNLSEEAKEHLTTAFETVKNDPLALLKNARDLNCDEIVAEIKSKCLLQSHDAG